MRRRSSLPMVALRCLLGGGLLTSALAFGACSSAPGEGHEGRAATESASGPQASITLQNHRARLSAVGARLLSSGGIEGFEPMGSGGVRLHMGAEPGSRSKPAAVVLPERATGSVRVRDVGGAAELEFSLVGAGDSHVALADGLAFYPGGGVHGSDLVIRARGDGVEDYLIFEHEPPERAVEYELTMRGVDGLRLVENTLELLDQSGTPRLRMSAPWILDADGHHRAVHVDTDCAHDSSPRAPWGRPVVSSGSETCRVLLSWDDQEIMYPAILDPAWTTTGALSQGRTSHAAVELQNGFVVLFGGFQSGGGSALASAELFDPVTGVWAVTGALPGDASELRGGLLPSSGFVLATGGWGSDQTAASLYDPATGVWTPTANMSEARVDHASELLSDGRLLVAGGASNSASAEVYDSVTGTWTSTGPMNDERRDAPSATLLEDGRMLVAGGDAGLDTAELLDPATLAWTPTGSMTIERSRHQAVRLQDGRVFAIGGLQNFSLNRTDLYDPASGLWTQGPTMAFGRSYFGAALLPNGNVLATGGESNQPPWYIVDVEIFRPGPNTWETAPSMAWGRWDHVATPLANGTVLITGGYNEQDDYVTETEIFGLVALRILLQRGQGQRRGRRLRYRRSRNRSSQSLRGRGDRHLRQLGSLRRRRGLRRLFDGHGMRHRQLHGRHAHVAGMQRRRRLRAGDKSVRAVRM